LEALSEQAKESTTLLVLPREHILQRSEVPGQKIVYVSTVSVNFQASRQNLGNLLRLFRGCWESAGIICGFRPDIVVSFGSIVSLPLVFWAWLFRIKVVLHEQNVFPGRANQLMARWADKIALSFRQTLLFFKNQQAKLVVSGCPLRRRLRRLPKKEALAYFGLAADKFTLLVMGGSQASQRINREFLRCLTLLENKSALQVLHLGGAKEEVSLRQAYNSWGEVNFRLFPFLEAMEYAYSAADLAICRAGAVTISELAFFRLPAILIPYPYASGHQLANARLLSTQHCAVLIEEDELSAERLKEEITALVSDVARLQAMRTSLEGITPPDAAKLLVELLMAQ
jgi:UDP-N-acetylglucosamine--N-acetylmuramyl-(pentapeptide) pyrophosphoryl-undecaprenol N-acetylglucosamine transferase